MREYAEFDGETILDFLCVADIQNFAIEETTEKFDEANFRYLDFVAAHGCCPVQAGIIYNQAKEAASETRDITYYAERAKGITELEAQTHAFEAYCQIMTKLFFEKFIHVRWNRFRACKNKTSDQGLALYRDYLNALVVPSYVEYTPVSSA